MAKVIEKCNLFHVISVAHSEKARNFCLKDDGTLHDFSECESLIQRYFGIQAGCILNAHCDQLKLHHLRAIFCKPLRIILRIFSLPPTYRKQGDTIFYRLKIRRTVNLLDYFRSFRWHIISIICIIVRRRN